jgi:hypothetical protein
MWSHAISYVPVILFWQFMPTVLMTLETAYNTHIFNFATEHIQASTLPG